MPLSSDVTTGGRSTAVDRDILAAAAAGARSRGTETTRTSPAPIAPQSLPMRGPTHPSNVTGHENPVPSQMFAPDRSAEVQRLVADELAMKTGALTTVPEVEDYSFKMPTRDEQVRAELKANGVWGTGLDVGVALRNQRERESGRQEHTADEELAAMSEAERAFKSGMRATRRGMNSGGRFDKTQAMTSEEYAALSPRQKAAVELNSMLAEAAAADSKVAQKGNPGGAEYDAAVEKLFAGEGKSAPYAPNTVGVLENIGWTGVGTDLEDILSGKAGFTRQDIEDLAPPREGEAPDASLTTGNSLRDSLQSSLVKAFAAARKEPVQGENLLAAKQDLLGYAEKPGFSVAAARQVAEGVDVNSYMRTALEFLVDSNSGVTPEQVMAQTKQTLTPTEFAQFLDFVDATSRDSKNYRQALGDEQGKTYFDPVEFRQSIAAVLRKERGDARS